jgi:predicted phosphodiesterase
MRYLIVSDMHGNWDALQTVLSRVSSESFDRWLVLGDLVGYGASPNEVVEAVREAGDLALAIRGNHDKVAAGLEDGSSFNELALAAARWTARQLTAENLEYVRGLTKGPVQVEEEVIICHGSPLDEDEYVLSTGEAVQIFAGGAPRVSFFGHTHVPSLFTQGDGEVEATVLRGDNLVIELEPDFRYLINPGSVGQPRDADPRAAYMIFDSREMRVEWWRVEYPVGRAQDRILEAGLPTLLADRLVLGL